jgi:hypothetical protein
MAVRFVLSGPKTKEKRLYLTSGREIFLVALSERIGRDLREPEVSHPAQRKTTFRPEIAGSR